MAPMFQSPAMSDCKGEESTVAMTSPISPKLRFENPIAAAEIDRDKVDGPKPLL